MRMFLIILCLTFFSCKKDVVIEPAAGVEFVSGNLTDYDGSFVFYCSCGGSGLSSSFNIQIDSLGNVIIDSTK